MPWEPLRTLLPLLAVLLAAAALAVALRVLRHHRRLARALAREWGLRTGRGRRGRDDTGDLRAPPGAGVAELERALEQTELRLRALTQRLSELESRPSGAAGGRGPAPAAATEPERVRAHLEALGFEEVTLLPGEAPAGTLLYEAREQGMPRKGAARVGPDGRVVVTPAATHRAFP